MKIGDEENPGGFRSENRGDFSNLELQSLKSGDSNMQHSEAWKLEV